MVGALKRLLLAGWLALGFTQPAKSEPISALLVSLASAAGVGGLVGLGAGGIVFTAAGNLLVAGLGLALSIGANLLLAAIFKQEGPKPQDVHGLVRQSVPQRMRHYGKRRLGGAMLFLETLRGNIYIVIAFGQGPFDGIEDRLVDQRQVVVNEDNWVMSYPYEDVGATEPLNRRMRLFEKLGTDDQTAFDLLLDKFPSIYTADHRCRGIAVGLVQGFGVAQEKFSQIYPNRIPVYNVIARTSIIYDPRDVAQDVDDASTWLFTGDGYIPGRNLALQLADYLRHGDGAQISADYIDWDLVSAAADVCDEEILNKELDTVVRYRGGLSYSLPSEPKTVIERFLTAMDGRLWLTPEGKIGMQAGSWIEPTVTIENGNIISYALADRSGPLKESNEIIVKYVDEAFNYAERSADPWRDEDSISLSGQVKSAVIEAYEIENHNHARRIAKINHRRLNPRWQGTITTNLAGLRAWDQRWINVQIDDYEIDEAFEVVSIDINLARLQVTIGILSFDETAYAFDAATEEGTAPATPEQLEENAIPTPVITDYGSTTREVASGSLVNVIFVEWEDPIFDPDEQNNRLEAQAQISEHGEDVWYDMALDPGGNRAESAIVILDGESYDVRVRFRSTYGAVGSYEVITNIPAVAVAGIVLGAGGGNVLGAGGGAYLG